MEILAQILLFWVFVASFLAYSLGRSYYISPLIFMLGNDRQINIKNNRGEKKSLTPANKISSLYRGKVTTPNGGL
jgi:hypothetical protein